MSKRKTTRSTPVGATADKTAARRAIMVLGMHRSGTSAITRVLNLLGVELGSRLMPPAPDNPTGFWEHLDAVEIHDRLLGNLGRSWDDFRPLPAGWLHCAAAQRAQQQILQLIQSEFSDAPLWAVKDPRLCLFVPLWERVLHSLGIEPCALIVLREPAEIARSLHERNAIPAALGEALWCRYTAEAIRSSVRNQHAELRYSRLLQDWRTEMKRLESTFALNMDWSEPAMERIDAFLHPARTGSDGVFDLTHFQSDRVSQALGAPELDLERLADAADAALAHIVREPLAYAEAEYLQVERTRFGEAEDRARRRIDEAERWARQLENEQQSTRTQLGELQREHERVTALAHSLDRELQDRNAVVTALRQDADRQREHIEQLGDQVALLQRQLDQVLQSRSWAITRPLRVIARVLRGEWGVLRAGLKRHHVQARFAQLMRFVRRIFPQPVMRDAAIADGARVAPEHIVQGESEAALRTGPVHSTGHTRYVHSPQRGHFGALAERFYRAIPVSGKRKRELKNWFFRSTGRVFASTAPYRRWQAYQRTHGQDAECRPSGTPASMQADPSPGFTVVAAGFQEVWRADGTREWLDYQTVRARIDGMRQRQRENMNPAPYPMVSIEPGRVGEAAAKILLPLAPAQPEVTILIPVFNHLSTTLECLASIAAHASAKDPTFEVLIANDGSTDATGQLLTTIQNLRLVNQPVNLGFLRNCNTAARHAKGRLLLLLNNDIQVTPGWLRALVDCLESSPDIGAVGPRVVYPSGWLQEAGARLLRDGCSEMIGLNDLPQSPRYQYSRDVDYCSGACLLLRTADFHRLRGFDECFVPAYCEDSDLCMRLCAEGKRTVYCADATVIHRLSTTSDSIPGDYKLRCIARNLTTFSSRWQADLDRLDSVRTIAFYLPQFHPIAENDRWWGSGFTEWTNVVKARPNFIGHDQPRLPADLGYYDLRVPEVMESQAALAKRYGLGGFCYYYYWFAGCRLLERPIEAMLANERPAFPFCLCWANENWTRRWDGEDHDVLMAQQHSDQDDQAVIRDLIRYFRSPHYIRIGGRPLIVVYRVALFPDFKRTAALWRQVCRDEGIGDIYIAHVESFEMVSAGVRPADVGCDAAIEFPPHGMAEPYPLTAPLLNPNFQGAVADYRDLAVRYATRELPAYKRFPGVATGWDNTARRQNNSYCFEHATPGAFQAWLETAIEITKQQFSGDERLVFINAWNEWAEGAYLEPDQRFGHAYLQAHANACEAAHLMRYDRYSLG